MAGIKHRIFGGYSSGSLGGPRESKDIDCIASLSKAFPINHQVEPLYGLWHGCAINSGTDDPVSLDTHQDVKDHTRRFNYVLPYGADSNGEKVGKTPDSQIEGWDEEDGGEVDMYSTDTDTEYTEPIVFEGVTRGIPIGEYLPDKKPRRIVYANLNQACNVLSLQDFSGSLEA
ncbi:MAG: hypothetical protein M1816_007934 [Peltula sp. TS41687]|nr:MAG: hypothetical protein M1816_007934 [Peltula sp. TS41687]